MRSGSGIGLRSFRFGFDDFSEPLVDVKEVKESFDARFPAGRLMRLLGALSRSPRKAGKSFFGMSDGVPEEFAGLVVEKISSEGVFADEMNSEKVYRLPASPSALAARPSCLEVRSSRGTMSCARGVSCESFGEES